MKSARVAFVVLLAACGGSPDVEDTESVSSAIIDETAPCVHVVDASDASLRSFCSTGSPGQACRSDRLSSSTTCQQVSATALQDAITWASAHAPYVNGRRQIRLDRTPSPDSKPFWMVPQPAYGGLTGGVLVPSNFQVEGTVAANGWEAGSWVQQLDIGQTFSAGVMLVDPAGYATYADRDKPVSNIVIKNIKIRGFYANGSPAVHNALWGFTSTGNVSLERFNARDTARAIVLGWFDPANPQWDAAIGKLRSKLWAFNGSSAEAKNLVQYCYTENVPGDTIVVMGHHNKVHGCTVTNSPPVSTAFNGILVYGGYSNIEITGNNINGIGVGIGLDGSFLAACVNGDPACSCTANDTPEQCMDRWNAYVSAQGVGQVKGYNSQVTISGNIINMPAMANARGIQFHRDHSCDVSGNTVNGPGRSHAGSIGIHLSESDSNFLWSNTVRNANVGIQLSAGSGSRTTPTAGVLYGSSYNGIGVARGTFAAAGNVVQNNETNIKLLGAPGSSTARVSQNTIAYNQFNNTMAFSPAASCNYELGSHGIDQATGGSEKQYCGSGATGNSSSPTQGAIQSSSCNYVIGHARCK
ncbi:NosD domain-containing protein [Sorangium sp. So ce448]|uniref:NosD domain-containing protein n=1 Tax=Sorangium sp. So ce448 TaxID=3133314 RepID=UPI003F6190FE